MIRKETKKEEILKIADCRRCGHCCRYGSGFLGPDDASSIAEFLGVTEEKLRRDYLEEVDIFNTPMLRPKKEGTPYGRCIFLEDNLCSIHDVKPLQCRIGTCEEKGHDIMEWFYLNYCVKPFDRASISQWKERLKSNPTIPGGKVEELVPDEKARKGLGI